RMLAGQAWRQPTGYQQSSTAPSRPELSYREKQILDLAAQGLKNREIAAKVGLSVATIKHYISLVVRKWGVRNRVEAVVLHSRQGQDVPSPSNAPAEEVKM